jgi:DUF4097 and DUF4098 domain-containing protein YvlB
MKTFLRTNTQRAAVRDIDKISIRYELDEVVLLKTDGEELVLEEYFSWDMEECDAEISVAGRDLTIKGGMRPPNSNGNSLIKIYLPASYRNNLWISNDVGSVISETDLESRGQIDIKVGCGSLRLTSISAETTRVEIASGSLDLDKIRGRSFISSLSGTIRLGEICGQDHEIRSASGVVEIKNSCADNLKIQCQSGCVVIGSAAGLVEASCASGNMDINGMNGTGVFTNQCGNIALFINGTRGSYTLNSQVGNITMSVPRGVPCALDAKSMMSSIQRSSGDAPGLVINARAGVGAITITEHEKTPA